jgi:MFS family permease
LQRTAQAAESGILNNGSTIILPFGEIAFMTGTLSRMITLLAAAGILLVGHGLQLTLLPLHAEVLGWSAYSIGLSGSAYFSGFVVGCMSIPAVVGRVGHIRTFMVMGAIATIALLFAGLLVSLPFWLVLRFCTGFALSGLYIVMESWLAETAPTEQRGTVLALYSMICLISMSIGQAFLGLASPMTLQLFAVGAILICFATIPIGLTRMPAPLSVPSARFSATALTQAPRVAVVCAFFGGLITGSFWTIGPVVGRNFDLSAGQIGAMMSAGILGGALSQLPIGRLSDRTDRRYVIAGMLASGALVAGLGWDLADSSELGLYAVFFFIGAATMPLYALCIVHASDNAEIPLVEVASGILITNSMGAIIGPVVTAMMVENFGASSFFLFVLLCLSIAFIWTVHRIWVVERPRQHDVLAAVLPNTTQAVSELSPLVSHSESADRDQSTLI